MFPWALSLGKVQVGSDCSRKVATYVPYMYLPYLAAVGTVSSKRKQKTFKQQTSTSDNMDASMVMALEGKRKRNILTNVRNRVSNLGFSIGHCA